jgi:beta-galactosidase
MKHDILAGGFIWDWVDQGLREYDADGIPYWTYGGDYGPPDVPSSGNFNFNGIVFPDRREQPAYWEVKRVYQHVDFSLIDQRAGRVGIHNRYNFIGLDDFELQWEVIADGRIAQAGVVSELAVPAENRGEVRLQYNSRVLRPGPEYFLNLRLVAPEAIGILPADHVIAEAQFELESRVTGIETTEQTASTLATRETEQAIEISGDGFALSFSRETGQLETWLVDGRPLLLAPLRPNLWRPMTDNDFGNYMDTWAAVWQHADQNQSLRSLEILAASADQAAIRAVYDFSGTDGEPVAEWTAEFRVDAAGAVTVKNCFERHPDLPVLPRVGMNVELDSALDRVEWYGRGPFENYRDRKLAANVGRYRNRVADHYVPYMRPQENGYKTDVRWLALSDGSDIGLLIVGDGLFSFGVHHNRQSDFVPPVKIAITSEDGEDARENAERVNMHVNDIKPRQLVSLNIDHGQMGVGGDDSWGKRTLQKYSLNEASYVYSFRMQPWNPRLHDLEHITRRKPDTP